MHAGPAARLNAPMADEIERKFLVPRLPPLHGVEGRRLVQGYLRADEDASVRVRIAGDAAFLTVKGPARGLRRAEYEYPIPVQDAERILRDLCIAAPVEKVRYRLEHAGYLWELDVFEGRNAGLVVAEVELDDPAEEPPRPPWVGEEVSGDPRYLNARLAFEPFADWR